MTDETRHTPTPWFSGEVSRTYDDGIEYINISAGDGYHVCKVSSREFEEDGSQNKANADHIVKCVNMHDELVEALKIASKMLFATNNHQNEGYKFLQDILKKAGAL